MASTRSRLVVVSGASRGVGVGICRQTLQLDATADVVITARNLDKAKEIQKQLAAGASTSSCGVGLDERIHAYQCDVTDESSCASLVQSLVDDRLLHPLFPAANDREKSQPTERTRPLSIINNAGVALDLPWLPTPWSPTAAKDTLAVNLYGAQRLTRLFLPHLSNSSDGRVVFVSSGAGRANMKRMDETPRQKLLSEDLTWEDICSVASIFEKEFKSAATAAAAASASGEQIKDEESLQQLPFLSPSSGLWLQSYGFSKACLGAYCQVLSRQYPTLLSVACSPGFIQTDMTKQYGNFEDLKSVEEGGEVEAWLATTSERGCLESGAFYQPSREVVSWVADGDVKRTTTAATLGDKKEIEKASRRLTTLQLK